VTLVRPLCLPLTCIPRSSMGIGLHISSEAIVDLRALDALRDLCCTSSRIASVLRVFALASAPLLIPEVGAHIVARTGIARRTTGCAAPLLDATRRCPGSACWCWPCAVRARAVPRLKARAPAYRPAPSVREGSCVVSLPAFTRWRHARVVIDDGAAGARRLRVADVCAVCACSRWWLADPVDPMN
jgi:hypothetical protein